MRSHVSARRSQGGQGTPHPSQRQFAPLLIGLSSDAQGSRDRRPWPGAPARSVCPRRICRLLRCPPAFRSNLSLVLSIVIAGFSGLDFLSVEQKSIHDAIEEWVHLGEAGVIVGTQRSCRLLALFDRRSLVAQHVAEEAVPDRGQSSSSTVSRLSSSSLSSCDLPPVLASMLAR